MFSGLIRTARVSPLQEHSAHSRHPQGMQRPGQTHPLCSSCSPPWPPGGWGPGDLVVVAVAEGEQVPVASSSADQPGSQEIPRKHKGGDKRARMIP